MHKREDISILIGKTIKNVIRTDDSVDFFTKDDKHFIMYHQQDCCESVYIDDIDGNLDDLIDATIIDAYENSNTDLPPKSDYGDSSHTWTFYRIVANNGTYITIRWYGESNGYYSESVDFVEVINSDCIFSGSSNNINIY